MSKSLTTPPILVLGTTHPWPSSRLVGVRPPPGKACRGPAGAAMPAGGVAPTGGQGVSGAGQTVQHPQHGASMQRPRALVYCLCPDENTVTCCSGVEVQAVQVS